jgi:hypothetical protein
MVLANPTQLKHAQMFMYTEGYAINASIPDMGREE